jgi:periplasmic protein TonB
VAKRVFIHVEKDTKMTKTNHSLQSKAWRGGHVMWFAALAMALSLSGCKTPPAATPAPASSNRPAAAPPSASASSASSEKAYRQDGARHLYAKHSGKVFKGMLPPNIPAVGVVDTFIDSRGNVTSIVWRRKPSDQTFMPITESMIRAAAPFPVPAKMGKVVYSDIWLWEAGGRFQLDTLTEGQSNN